MDEHQACEECISCQMRKAIEAAIDEHGEEWITDRMNLLSVIQPPVSARINCAPVEAAEEVAVLFAEVMISGGPAAVELEEALQQLELTKMLLRASASRGVELEKEVAELRQALSAYEPVGVDEH